MPVGPEKSAKKKCFPYLPQVSRRSGAAACLLAAVLLGTGLLRASRLTGPEARALTALNDARARAGAGVLAPDWRLTIASRRQAEHMARTNEIRHDRLQNKGVLDSQETPEGRRLFAFYLDRGAEALARSFVQDPEQAVGRLLHAPYHRISLLDPGAQRAGVGLVSHTRTPTKLLDTAFTLGSFRDTSPRALVAWPPAGAKNIPAFFLPDTETPNPAPGSRAVGYIVTLQAGTDQTLVPHSFILRDSATGELVAGRVASSLTDTAILPQAVAFIPSKPLAWDTGYTVDFRGTASFGVVGKSWSFRTAPAPVYALTITSVETQGASLYFQLSSPAQPVQLCYKSTPGTKLTLSWIGSEQFKLKVSDCGAATCAVQVFLSSSRGCSTKEVRIGALFGGRHPRTAPELQGHS